MIRPVTPALVAVILALSGGVAHAAPGTLDTSKQADRIEEKRAPEAEKVPVKKNNRISSKRVPTKITPRADERAVINQERVPIKRDETIQDKRFDTPQRPDDPRIERKESVLQDKRSRWAPQDNQNRFQSKTALRFQEKLNEAKSVYGERKVAADQKTTFDKVNRFAFRKNGDRTVGLTQAGSGQDARDISGQSTPASTKP